MRRTLLVLGFALAAPLVLSVGLGVHHRLGALEQALVLGLLSLYSSGFEASPVALYPVLGLPVLLLVAVATGALLRWGSLLPRRLRIVGRAIEALWALFGMLGLYGVVVVGIAIDRPLFWTGILLMGLSSSLLPDRGWRRRMLGAGPLSLRTVAAVGAGAAGMLAGFTLLEGPGSHSPVFQWGELWLDWVGGSAWAAGLIWLVMGLVVSYWACEPGPVVGRRSEDSTDAAVSAPGIRSRVSGLVAGAACLCLLAWEWSAAPSVGRAIAGTLSAAGLVVLALSAGKSQPRAESSPSPAPLPVQALFAAAPLIAWAVLCASRGLLVGLWVQPQPQPPGFETLSARTGLFALRHDPSSGRIFFTDRDDIAIGFLDPSGAERVFPLEAEGVDSVEELWGPHGSLLYASTSFSPEEQENEQAAYDDGGFHILDLDEGLLTPFRLTACLISSLIPIPPSTPADLDLQAGDVLIGCEGNRAGHVFRPEGAELVGKIPLEDDLEAGAFHPDGNSLFGVSLWGMPEIFHYSWPSGELLGSREIGSFNWEIAVDSAGQIFLPRFFEGVLLVLDDESLETLAQVPLSFGVRAMALDDRSGTLWVSASYSGILWAVDTQPPFARRAYPVCGQARDLIVDDRGRAVLATDCGIVRVDPAAVEVRE